MSNLTALKQAMQDVENLERLESEIAAQLGDPEGAPREPGDGTPSPGGDKPSPGGDKPADPSPGDDKPIEPSPAGDTPTAKRFEFPGKLTAAPIFRPEPVPTVNQLVHQVERAFAEQRARVRDMEGDHVLAIEALKETYRRRAEDLMHEANEACRALEQKQDKALAAEQETLETLRRLRG